MARIWGTKLAANYLSAQNADLEVTCTDVMSARVAFCQRGWGDRWVDGDEMRYGHLRG